MSISLLFLFLRLTFTRLFRVKPIVKLNIETCGHTGLVAVSDLASQVFRNPKYQLLAELQKVIFSELLDFVRPRRLKGEATRFNGECIADVVISKNTESGTITLVSFVTKFAIFDLKIW